MTIALYFVVLLAFSVLFTREVIAPASGARCDRRWMVYAGGLNAVQVGFTLGAGVVFRDWFSSQALFHLPPTLPSIVAGVICFLSASLIAYGWHRAMHRFDVLWRVFHQLHHSPSRIEALTAFYMHPLDGIAATFINALCAYVVWGASADAAAWGLLFAALYNLFIHADIRSPRWLGFIIQRPEMHRVHHQRGYHAGNYGLPIWDLVFRTWHNPRDSLARCGFSPENEHRIVDMLIGKDVHVGRARKPV